MRNLHVTLLLTAVLLGGCSRSGDGTVGAFAGERKPGWKLSPPRAEAQPVQATSKMPGIYPAGSVIPDRQALGGFGPCTNYPWELADQDWGEDGAISVVAFPDEPVAYFKHRGIALRVINRTGKAVPFEAGDSALSLVREAQDANGNWHAIETLPEPICGNSHHRVFLDADEYWQFPAREYAGSTKTKLRFRLNLGRGKPPIYSNEFEGQISAEQLNGK